MDNETQQCENCRIEITTKGIKVEDTGSLYLEAGIIVGLLALVSLMYIGKKWIDRRFK
jgi:hypothetical protein|tara:strand:- start:150 stop:323 length:174 start_codon:yes stop_codon:yes gene_type:complete